MPLCRDMKVIMMFQTVNVIIFGGQINMILSKLSGGVTLTKMGCADRISPKAVGIATPTFVPAAGPAILRYTMHQNRIMLQISRSNNSPHFL